jgi:DNA-directed RNA polymerase subunit RPC12/RpoP
MTLKVSCISCAATFDAVRHAGLVRCAPCDERLAFRLPGTGLGQTVVILDTPGEAWA